MQGTVRVRCPAPVGMTSVTPVTTKAPVTIRFIEVMGGIGIAFWLVTIVRTFIDGANNAVAVLLVGLVLGGAHAVVTWGARTRSRAYLYAIGIIFVGDLLLALFVDARAFALVAFTIALGVLAALPSSRDWLRQSA